MLFRERVGLHLHLELTTGHCGLTNPQPSARMERFCPLRNVGLWRSWERASMAWKRSSVRSRPGPPIKYPIKYEPEDLGIEPESIDGAYDMAIFEDLGNG